MTFTDILISLAGSYLLIQFIFLPLLKYKLRSSGVDSSPRISGFLTAFSYLRTALFVNLFSAVSLSLFLQYQTYQAQSGAENSINSIRKLQNLNAQLDDILPEFSGVVVLLLGLALVIMSYRRGKLKVNNVIEAAREIEFERIKEAYINETLEEIEPNEAMLEAMEAINSRVEAINDFPNKINEALATLPEEEHEDIIKAYQQLQSEYEEGITELQGHYLSIDIARRVDENLKVDNDKFSIPPAQNFFEHVQNLFMSKGLMRSLSTGSHVLIYALLLSFIPSLISMQAAGYKHEIDNQTVTIQGIYLSLENDNLGLDSSVPIILEQEADDSDISSENAQVLDELASIYEQSFVDNVLPSGVSTLAVSTVIKSNAIRQSLLRAVNPSAAFNNPLQGSVSADDYNKNTQRILKKKPVTELGQSFRQQLKKKIKLAGPNAWGSLRKGLIEFKQPSNAADIRKYMLGKSSSDIIFNRPNSTANANLRSSAVADKVGDLHKIKSSQFADDLISGDVKKATSRLNQSNMAWNSTQVESYQRVVRDLPSDSLIERKIKNNSPGLVNKPEKHVNFKGVDKTLRKMKSMNLRVARNAELFTESMHSYQSLFPDRVGVGFNSPRGKLLADIEPDKYAKSSSKARTASKAAYARSRSFSRLRGFSRIGGVLIGNYDPENLESLDFADITWRFENKKVYISLMDKNDKSFEFGPYSPEIVRLALLYAADGRPTTVTMISSKPLLELKILLHPVLVDTALGCYAIKLDRFVEKYNDVFESHRNLVSEAKAFYGYSWALQASALASSSTFKLYVDDSDTLKAIENAALIGMENNRVNDFNYSSAKDYLNSTKSPLSVKNNFFDSRLVNRMMLCSEASDDVEKYTDCLRTIEDHLSTYDYSNDFRWFSRPDFQMWSGVREAPFKLDNELDFLNANNKEAQWPLKFIDQVAFTSDPVFYDGTAEDYIDQPWMFPHVQKKIQENVSNGVANGKDKEDILIAQYMSEFSLLQRLFRVVLSGKLGDSNFPSEKLVNLNEELAPYKQKPHRTMRWNVRPNILEINFLKLLINNLDSISGSALTKKTKICLAWGISVNDQGKSLSAVKQSSWKKKCDFSQFLDSKNGLDQQIADAGVMTLLARQLRLDYGVSRDDKQASKGDVCPLIH